MKVAQLSRTAQLAWRHWHRRPPAILLPPEVKSGVDQERVRPGDSNQVTLVTTPSEIILYYCLNHSIWSLSDNKQSSR
jgi:hypothetical protein